MSTRQQYAYEEEVKVSFFLSLFVKSHLWKVVAQRIGWQYAMFCVG